MLLCCFIDYTDFVMCDIIQKLLYPRGIHGKGLGFAHEQAQGIHVALHQKATFQVTLATTVAEY